jgi:hypothetical protein
MATSIRDLIHWIRRDALLLSCFFFFNFLQPMNEFLVKSVGSFNNRLGNSCVQNHS